MVSRRLLFLTAVTGLVAAGTSAALAMPATAAPTPTQVRVKAAALPDVSPVNIGAAGNLVYVRGTDGKIYWRTISAIAPWRQVPVTVASGPAATDLPGPGVKLYAKSTSGSLLGITHTPFTVPSVQDLGGALTSAPDATADPDFPSQQWVVARGTDNKIWLRRFTSFWYPWISLGGIGTSAPSITWNPDEDYPLVSVRGTDGRTWERRADIGDSWEVVNDAIVTSRQDINYELNQNNNNYRLTRAWRSTDNALWLRSGQNNSKLGGLLTSGPTLYLAPGDQPNQRYIFVRGGNGELYQYHNGAFSSLGGAVA